MEACRLVIFRTGIRRMADDFRMERRTIHPVLGVPIPQPDPQKKRKMSTRRSSSTYSRETPG